MKEELNRRERLELVDLLRKQLLYQTPKPIFRSEDDEHPAMVELRFIFPHYHRIKELLNKAGGWTMTVEDREKQTERQEALIKKCYADGTNYDFSEATYGELLMMLTELEELASTDEPLIRFRQAVAEELGFGAEQ